MNCMQENFKYRSNPILQFYYLNYKYLFARVHVRFDLKSGIEIKLYKKDLKKTRKRNLGQSIYLLDKILEIYIFKIQLKEY